VLDVLKHIVSVLVIQYSNQRSRRDENWYGVFGRIITKPLGEPLEPARIPQNGGPELPLQEKTAGEIINDRHLPGLMLRDKERNLRIEEVSVLVSFAGKPISALDIKKYPSMLLLAVKTRDDLIYNPSDDYIIQYDNTLIFMTTPEERQEFEETINSLP